MLRLFRRSEKVVQGGEPQTVQERRARRANGVILFQFFDYNGLGK